MNVMHAEPKDFVLLAAVIALGAGIVVLNIVSPGVGLRF